MKDIKITLKETFSHWQSKNPARMSASLSYFAIFSMAPFFVFLVAIAGIFFTNDIVENKLLYELSSMTGNDITGYFSGVVGRNAFSHGTTLVSGFLGFLILLFGATGVYKELSYSMDKIWSSTDYAEPRRIKGFGQIVARIKGHVPIILFMLLLSILFVASIVSSLSMQVVGDYIQVIYPNAFGLIKLLEPLFSFIFVALFFGAIYRVLPKIKLPLSEIAFGASVTAIVFLVGELIIGFYLSNFHNGSIFGAAGSLISIMLWVYFSAQVFFFGASFTYIYSKRYGYLKEKST